MAIAVEMPKMSDTMEEGVLVAWLVEEGSTVAPGDILAQVETDKATMDLESYDDGVLLRQIAKEGEPVPIGGLIAVLGTEGEDVSSLLAEYGHAGAASGAADHAVVESRAGGDGVDAPEAIAHDIQAVPSVLTGSRIKSSPLARKLAIEHGLDLLSLRGTGPDGRIVKRDIEAALQQSGQAITDDVGQGAIQTDIAGPPQVIVDKPKDPLPAVVAAPVVEAAAESSVTVPEPTPEVVRISQMRKAIARRLSESKYSSPHFYLTVDVDMVAAIDARAEINRIAESQALGKISFNDLVTKACAGALRVHPMVNSSYDQDAGVIRHHRQVHVAVAVAVDEGLVTPVIRNTDMKGLAEIARETRVLAERARNKQLQPEEYSDSTFTTSNLGMFGIEEFTAIINPPNACILAIGAIRDEAIVEDGRVVAGKRMRLTLSCDHRIVDGVTGARFLATVRDYLQYPSTMLL